MKKSWYNYHQYYIALIGKSKENVKITENLSHGVR